MNTLLHELRFGNTVTEGNIFLAPMAGYTDRVFRALCLKHGADMAVTEMVSCEGLARDSVKTIDLMARAENEKILNVQLFAPDSDTAKRSCAQLMKANPQIVDFNCGCPVPKVVKTGAGSALMKNPDEIGRIVRTLTEETGLPVTVKIRTGWDTSSMNYLQCAEKAFSNGAAALTMHARTKSQLYMPYAHWECLKDLKEHFPHNIILGSGDLFSAEDGVRMLEETGVDGIMYARGAVGNPFIFERTRALLRGETPREITTEEKISTVMEQLEGMKDMLGEDAACREMRKHVCCYLKGIKNSARVRHMASSAMSIQDYKEALEQLT
ncbi:MAG: tRNA dihydrouridine synthase DusB [Sphaerochaetaceae bacterium]|nr:tRNA dihydrouridine synthase DusB [Sphaerochaetaceae bacterium]